MEMKTCSSLAPSSSDEYVSALTKVVISNYTGIWLTEGISNRNYVAKSFRKLHIFEDDYHLGAALPNTVCQRLRFFSISKK